jgi:hypothetical protein
MIGCEEDDKPPPTLEGLINCYKRWISTKRLHTKTLGSFAAQETAHATLAITEPRSNNRRLCVCGLSYELRNCFILNPEARGQPEGYKPNRIGPTLRVRERRPNADRIYDADLNGDYYANTAFRMAQIAAPRGDSLSQGFNWDSLYKPPRICSRGSSARDADWLRPKRVALCAGPYAHDSSLSATTLFLCPMHTGTLALVL